MRGSITVEAAVLCPFLCLVIYAMILVTFFLYDIVADFGEEATKTLHNLSRSTNVLRIERMICEEREE